MQLPLWMTSVPSIEEDVISASASSDLQQETAEDCLPLLTGNANLVEVNRFGLPRLTKRKHIRFLNLTLRRVLPAPYTGLDASRPWLIYWCTVGLHLLGDDLSAFQDK